MEYSAVMITIMIMEDLLMELNWFMEEKQDTEGMDHLLDGKEEQELFN